MASFVTTACEPGAKGHTLNLGNGCTVDYSSVGWLVFPVTSIESDQCLPSPFERIPVHYVKHFSMKTCPGDFRGKNLR